MWVIRICYNIAIWEGIITPFGFLVGVLTTFSTAFMYVGDNQPIRQLDYITLIINLGIEKVQ